ncbi:MAG: CcoQ/FixQ family Cbb3-type cytochrome c oxidase assembly chaperone [Alphaproteobacteria bacterium]|nr:CcoQ/FixQ family Cbb3-type cytochrome c oxidase assembly chaperone [Alphaproteobacteria bacterium]
MTYEHWSHFAQTWGMIYFVVIFIAAFGYALWPANRKRFDEAARAPITEKERGDDRPLA